MTGHRHVPNLGHFKHRVLQDAFAEATARYWRRRAQQFEDARPRLGDFLGQSTHADLAAADKRCAKAAEACRQAAAVAVQQEVA